VASELGMMLAKAKENAAALGLSSRVQTAKYWADKAGVRGLLAMPTQKALHQKISACSRWKLR